MNLPANLMALGEFGLIERIKSFSSAAAPAGTAGIGDDCAVIPVSPEKSLLVSTDMLVAGRHFLAGHIPPHALGHKSLAVNLSDLAAMGGQPLYAFLSLGLPAETTVEWLDAFMAGFNALASQHGVILMGGDTSQSEHITINITVIGEANPTQIKYRHTAQVGDVICVTGTLGGSGAGLHAILKQNSPGFSLLPYREKVAEGRMRGIFKYALKQLYPSPALKGAPCGSYPFPSKGEGQLSAYLINQHYYPQPHLAQGQFLAEHKSVHAMMDISDGLAADLKHILKASNVGAILDVDTLPLSCQLKNFAQTHDLTSETIALTAGEDYCLLFTMAADAYETINQKFIQQFSQPLYKIGETTASAGLTLLKHGEPYQLLQTGFDHFGITP